MSFHQYGYIAQLPDTDSRNRFCFGIMFAFWLTSVNLIRFEFIFDVRRIFYMWIVVKIEFALYWVVGMHTYKLRSSIQPLHVHVDVPELIILAYLYFKNNKSCYYLPSLECWFFFFLVIVLELFIYFTIFCALRGFWLIEKQT